MTRKPKLYDAQDIGHVTEFAQERAGVTATNKARVEAILAYQNKFAEAYNTAFKAEFERAIYQTTHEGEDGTAF